MRYRPDLDGLRAIAVLAVFGSHTQINRAAGGWVGVDVFFVLSGYLITALLLAEQSAGAIALGRFYARRALRLYPALLLVLILGAPFYRDLGDGGTPGGYGRTAALSGLYVQNLFAGFTGRLYGNLSTTWSLAVEEQFYLLWPPVLVLLLARRRDPLRWTTGAVAASWALLFIGEATGGDQSGAFALPLPWIRFSPILVGCCAAILLARGSAPGWLKDRRTGWAILAVALAFPVLADNIQTYPNAAWEIPAIGVITALLLGHLAHSRAGPRALLSWRPLAYLGRRSYGFYLFHYPVIKLLDPRVHTGKAATVLAELAVTLVLTIASYRFVERPFLRLKHRRFEPPSHRPEPVPT